MPSLQTALPPELANNVIRLYRECLRRAKFIGYKQHNTDLVVSMVRQQFRKNMHETDPEKIQKFKDDSTVVTDGVYRLALQHLDVKKIRRKLISNAARGLINHILHESERMSGRKFSQSS